MCVVKAERAVDAPPAQVFLLHRRVRDKQRRAEYLEHERMKQLQADEHLPGARSTFIYRVSMS